VINIPRGGFEGGFGFKSLGQRVGILNHSELGERLSLRLVQQFGMVGQHGFKPEQVSWHRHLLVAGKCPNSR
jgi:hypothetical protein